MSRNTIYVNNKAVALTPEDMRQIKCKALNLLLVEKRMNHGWSKEEATTLRRDYITKWGSIYWRRDFPDVTLYVPLNEMQKIKIERYQINKKYQEGKSFEEIIGDDFDYYLEEHKPTFNVDEIEKKKKLAELIQWAWDEKQRDEHYESDLGRNVHFNIDCSVISDPMITNQDIFTLEVEEEITEDTKIPTLMVVYDFPEEKGIYCNTYYNLSIKYILDTKNNEVNIKSFHMVNQDGTLTLLWTKEGGMVE